SDLHVFPWAIPLAEASARQRPGMAAYGRRARRVIASITFEPLLQYTSRSEASPILQQYGRRGQSGDVRDDLSRAVELCVADVTDITEVRLRVRQIVHVEGDLRLADVHTEPQIGQRVAGPGRLGSRAADDGGYRIADVAVIPGDEPIDIIAELPGVDRAQGGIEGRHSGKPRARLDAAVKERAWLRHVSLLVACAQPDRQR